MRLLERRLRRLEEEFLPRVEMEAPCAVLLALQGRRAEQGLPALDIAPLYRPGISIGEAIRAGVQRMREHRASEKDRDRS